MLKYFRALTGNGGGMVLFVPEGIAQGLIVASVVSSCFFHTKIEQAVRSVGKNTFCDNSDAVRAMRPNIILVDLEHPDAHHLLREYGSKVIAFGPHLIYDLNAIAEKYGARVYPRGAFLDNLEHMLLQRS